MASAIPEIALAQPASNRAALTFGTAAATLAVVIGVLAGPAMVECSTSSDGLGACLRGKIDGLVGAPAPVPVTAETESPAAPPTPAPVEQASPAPTAPAMPTLGLVSAQPDGSLVIAGTAEPGAEVTVFGNGLPIGTVTALRGGARRLAVVCSASCEASLRGRPCRSACS